jgi:hypothetical protein
MRALLILVLGLLCLAMTSCPKDGPPEGAPANAGTAGTATDTAPPAGS